MPYKVKNKVFAYIIRKKGDKLEMLIFRHRDFPEAGLQVPAGTIENGEDKISALRREVQEESGLETFKQITFLGTQQFIATSKQEIHHRFFYQMLIEDSIPDEFEHIVSGNGLDKDLVFIYKWVEVLRLPKLIAEHDHFIKEIIFV